MAAEDDTQRINRLVPVDMVRARIEALVKPVEPREVDITAACFRMLAGDVWAGPRPARPLALRDGWAVESGLTIDAGSYAPAALPGAARIDAGERLPAGTDAIAPLDGVIIRAGRAEAIAPVVAGDGVLPGAADCDLHRPLLRAGRRLGNVEAAVLAGAGVAGVLVRAPRICLVRARPGQDEILEAARALIARLIKAAGGAPSEAAAGELAAALQGTDADAVIAIGGTGHGRNDTSVRTLSRVGRVEAHGIALSPGKTAAFGTVGGRPVLLMPGRIDAALAVWLMLGSPLLMRLCGGVEQEGRRPAVLARKIASRLGMTELVPVRCSQREAEPLASGYWPLQAMAAANGWIEVPADSEGYAAGSEVMVRPWP